MFAKGVRVTSYIVALLDTSSWHFASRRFGSGFSTRDKRAFSSFYESRSVPWYHVCHGSSRRYEAAALRGASFRAPVLRLCPSHVQGRFSLFANYTAGPGITLCMVALLDTMRRKFAARRSEPRFFTCAPKGVFVISRICPRAPVSGWRLMCPTVRGGGTLRRVVWVPGLRVTQLPWVDVHCYHFGFFTNWYYEGG